MPVPTQSRPEHERVQLEHARAACAGSGSCLAEYRSANPARSAAGTVRVVIAAPIRKIGEAGPLNGSGMSGAGQQSRRVGYTLQVAALGEDETLDSASGIGHLGGLAALSERDRFLVPGWAAGRPDLDGLTLTAHQGGRCHGGLWVAEVSA